MLQQSAANHCNCQLSWAALNQAPRGCRWELGAAVRRRCSTAHAAPAGHTAGSVLPLAGAAGGTQPPQPLRVAHTAVSSGSCAPTMAAGLRGAGARCHRQQRAAASTTTRGAACPHHVQGAPGSAASSRGPAGAHTLVQQHSVLWWAMPQSCLSSALRSFSKLWCWLSATCKEVFPDVASPAFCVSAAFAAPAWLMRKADHGANTDP